jgi:hypothetical protein
VTRPRVLAVLALALALGSCAPRNVPPPGLDVAAVPGRYLAALAEREGVGRALDAEVRVWLEGEAFGDLPGLSGTLLLGGPDRCRLKVSSLFGVLLDVAARGDTVTALMPARRLVLDLPEADDTLGVREPGLLAFRVWSGTWRPPDEAWRHARTEDSLLHVRWVEAGDSLDLAVDALGRPSTVRLVRPDGADLRCRYLGWDGVGPVSWPSWLEFEDAAGTVHAECRLGSLRARSVGDPARLVVRIPSNASRLEWSTLRAAIERLGGL